MGILQGGGSRGGGDHGKVAASLDISLCVGVGDRGERSHVWWVCDVVYMKGMSARLVGNIPFHYLLSRKSPRLITERVCPVFHLHHQAPGFVGYTAPPRTISLNFIYTTPKQTHRSCKSGGRILFAHSTSFRTKIAFIGILNSSTSPMPDRRLPS